MIDGSPDIHICPLARLVVEVKRCWPPVPGTIRGVCACERRDLGVLGHELANNFRDLDVTDDIHLIAGNHLGHAVSCSARYGDHALDFRHGRDTGLGSPPFRAAIHEHLIVGEPGHDPWTGRDRPALGNIEVTEGCKVASVFPNMCRQPVQPDVVVVDQVLKSKSGVRLVEVYPDGLSVYLRDRLNGCRKACTIE